MTGIGLPAHGTLGGEGARRLALAAAAITFGAGLIHLALAPAHFAEYVPFGALFVVTALAQVGWAEWLRRQPERRSALVAGAAINLGVAAVWLVSRTLGLPVGPDAGIALAIGPSDLVATVDEILAAALALAALTRRDPFGASSWAPAAAWVLIALSIVVALGDGASGSAAASGGGYLPAFSAT